jgi:hypothetical protein
MVIPARVMHMALISPLTDRDLVPDIFINFLTCWQDVEQS